MHILNKNLEKKKGDRDHPWFLIQLCAIKIISLMILAVILLCPDYE